MLGLCFPANDRVLATPTCSFKLYGPPLNRGGTRSLRSLASAWIGGVTAGFVLSKPAHEHLVAFWWEGEDLRRIALAPGRAMIARGVEEPMVFARLSDLALITFEAGSWTRHMVGRSPPSLPAYLSDLFA